MSREDDAVRPRRLRTSEHCSEVSRILDPVQHQEERGLAPRRGNREHLAQGGVTRLRNPGHDTLMVRCPGHRRELITRAVRYLDVPAPGQGQQLLECRAA